jgi:hypothetical protein
MSKKFGIRDRLADIEVRDDLVLAMTRDILARQHATERVVTLIATTLLTIVPPHRRRDLLNDVFAECAQATQNLGASAHASAEAADAAAFEAHIQLHLARLTRQMAACAAASSVGAVKN